MTSTDLARRVLATLVEAGVTEVVICPGSRNAPLSFAAYDAAAAGLVRLHTRIDERTAGFLALGLSKNHRRAAVVCTSGTGVANLHPAVLEAAHAGVEPLNIPVALLAHILNRRQVVDQFPLPQNVHQKRLNLANIGLADDAPL